MKPRLLLLAGSSLYRIHGLRNSHNISGTPSKAVSTPTGSSRGARQRVCQ